MPTMASGTENPLKDGVDEGGDGWAAGKDDEHPEEQQRNDDGQQPVFFAGPHEAPQVGEKVHICSPPSACKNLGGGSCDPPYLHLT